MNQKFQNALAKKNTGAPPIWIMRQAGRYHQHYQKMREKNSFTELCKIPELAAQVALGPVEDFDFDVAILFSDILFPLEYLGFGLDFTDKGPQLQKQLNSSNANSWKNPNEVAGQMQFQAQALKRTREILPKDKSLIGFVGGPFTLFSYAVQGRHEGGLIETKKNINLFEAFCEKYLLPFLIYNIEIQLKSAAECVMIFDTASGELSPQQFHQYVVPQLEKLAKTFPKKLGYYSRGTQKSHLDCSLFRDSQLFLGLGFDPKWKLEESFKSFPGYFIQGNFDQNILLQDTATFKKSLDTWLDEMKRIDPKYREAWVCGLGHGVLPKTPTEHVRHFVNRVRETFR